MQLTNLSLAYLIAELKQVFDGSILRKVQELENGWLKLRFQTRQGTKDLIAAPDAIFSTDFGISAKKTTSGYGAFLRKKLSNKKLLSLKQQGSDRIVVMDFEGFFLILELFAKGNVILTDKEMEIASAFRKERWKDRTLKKGEQYKFPSSKGINPGELDERILKQAFSLSETDVVRTVVKEVNIAPILAEAACANTKGLEKETSAKELKAKEIKALAAEIKALYLVDLKKAKPVLVENNGKKMLLPFPVNVSGTKVLQEFSTVNQAVDELFGKRFSEEIGSVEKKAFNKKKAELEISMQQQEEALITLRERVAENAKKAELIYSNYSTLFEMLNSLKGENLQEKEIMYKLIQRFPLLKSFDAKSKKITVSLEK